jgi:serine/threonine-protein kinase
MHSATQSVSSPTRRHGFTIVELLVVIVVIGILAAITLVTYNGIQQKARVASLQSDMSNAASQLEIDNVQTGTYPASAAVANSGAGLKASPGTTYQYTYTSASNSYCITGTNSGVSYFVSTTSQTPQTGVCPLAVSTLAGSGANSFADGTGSAARFSYPSGVAVDSAGTVYVADTQNNRIRKITSAGVVTTLAGSGANGSADGTGSAAQFWSPFGVAVDSSGTVYVADTNSQSIRKISPAGMVTTLAGGAFGSADGTGSAAQFKSPAGVAVDSSGTVYVGDSQNHLIRKITPSGVVTTLAGSGASGSTDGTGSAAPFNYPKGLAVDSSGTVYVADTNNNRIRKITSAGVVTTLAGSGAYSFADGTGSAAAFYTPSDVAVDSAGTVYVADSNNYRIRKISPAGVVTTLAGGAYGFADGTGSTAQFWGPSGVDIDSLGTLYVGDTSNFRIRKIQ